MPPSGVGTVATTRRRQLIYDHRVTRRLLPTGRDLAVDLGTANTLVYERGRGVVLDEPSVVAVDSATGEVVTAGRTAKEMLGRTPGSMRAVRPLRGGVVHDPDVTERMQKAGEGLSGQAFTQARDAEAGRIESEGCAGDPKVRCQVVSLYRGGQFKLYTYKKYSDVRLAWAPEDRAATFGGDLDNFSFPRFAIDAAFIRLYEDGKPVAEELLALPEDDHSGHDHAGHDHD